MDAWDFEGHWDRFEWSLKRETRYFNRTAEAILTTIFDGIDEHNTVGASCSHAAISPASAIPNREQGRQPQRGSVPESGKRASIGYS